MLNTVASKYKAPITVAFLICTLTLLPPLSSVQGSKASPYDSGYDHGCDDAGISDPSDRYINQDEKGPSYHTSEFMDGYYAGVNACSGSSSDETEYEDETEQQPESYDRDVPTSLSTQGSDFGPICNTLQIALYPSCSELVNPDGSLTYQGRSTVWCIVNGAAIGGIASTVIPLHLVLQGLNFLSEPTGCGGLVKLDILDSIGNINGIVNQLARLVT